MEYVHQKTIEKPGWVIRVHRPVISADEKAKRMKRIHKAAENLLKKVNAR